MRRSRFLMPVVAVALMTGAVAAPAAAAPADAPVSFTILHTNDFHGNLEWKSGGSSSNPGSARVAAYVNSVRDAVGEANTILVDAGDEMQGSLLSNIQQGEPTIATYNEMGYAAATFGNHEFDWGQDTLAQRVDQAAYPYVSANIVANDTGNCATANWTKAPFVDAPYEIKTIGIAPNVAKVAFIGVTTQETPIITMAAATAGLCFKDPAESIAHYYADMRADGADVIVVLSHLGYADGGYGYGVPIYGDQTLAQKLTTAGKPVDLIIGGHSHTSLATATVPAGTTTKVVQAAYNGRRVGRADVTVNPNGTAAINWTFTTVPTAADAPVDADVEALIASYASDPAYQELINQEIGYTDVPISRNYDGDSLMGAFVNDAIYGELNSDATASNDVEIVFNNPGGLRADIACAAYPCTLTYGMMYSILPFGNQTVTGTMTGDRILDLLHQSASLNKGALQVSGLKYKFYNYRTDTDPDPAKVNWKAWSWGAFEPCVVDKADGSCDPLELDKTYKVATNEFLAPAGQDNFYAFKYMKDITYWGDMLNQVNAWVGKTYTAATPFNGALDGRITRVGTDTGGPIVPVTILHHNDSHGNLDQGQYVGYTQLASLIKAERAWNPDRTLLLSGGDNIQGDAMSYYFKSAPLGYAADGTPLPAALQKQPLVAAFNAMGYDAMTLGNHEFNFGSGIFKAVLSDATFPIIGANVTDTGAYGLADVGVQPYVEKTVGPEGIKVAILGITNHRVPNYELPSNIPGLAFSDPLAKAQELSDALAPTTDAIVALTHIGFTEDPKSVEVDKNVDTNLATDVSGIDAIIGSHSHTNPAAGFGSYKYLPTVVQGPGQTPVLISQAYRYNNTLGEVFLGFAPKAGGGYELVSRAGQYITVGATLAEDPAINAIVDPYSVALKAYNDKVIGKTTAPIDALKAFTQETNAANLQADASVFELNQHGITPDIHISGAMTNRKVADGATAAGPVTLKVADMFTLMPYENSLVTMRMTGPQLKTVLERGYRNYYFYNYVPGYGGYSYYTTCMLDTNSVGRILYRDTYPAMPSGDNVVGLEINGRLVDFTDASTSYLVSTVNYLAAGSCNFNDGGKSLWPLDQIVNDTQYYVRDAVIDYITAMGTVSPKIEGRLVFADTEGPVVTITSPEAKAYGHATIVPLTYAVDDVSGLASVIAQLDGKVTTATTVDLLTLVLGAHTFSVTATDLYGNVSTERVEFSVKATVSSLMATVNRFYDDGAITSAGVRDSLLDKLEAAKASIAAGKTKAATKQLNSFIALVKAQSGKSITPAAATLLVTDAKYVINHL